MGQKTVFRTAGVTTEQVVHAGPVRIHAVRPDLTTTGTITLRNSPSAAGGAGFSVSAIGLTQAGKDFEGAVLTAGLTVQLSVGTDLCAIIYEPLG